MILHQLGGALLLGGGAGLAYFGTFLLAARLVDLSLVGGSVRRRINRWIRVAPSVCVICVIALLTGASLRW